MTDGIPLPLGARRLELTTVNDRANVAYLPDGERHILIGVQAIGVQAIGTQAIGTQAIGAQETGAQEPAWYHDILAQPRVTVRAGELSYAADAAVLQGEERDQLVARAVAADPAWLSPGLATAPVVALTPVFEGPPEGSLGDLLMKVHGVLRQELTAIRDDLSRSGPGLVAQLRINCLTFCHDLHGHHTGESAQIFPLLAEQQPGLAPVLARLEREHETVGRLLDDIQALLREPPAGNGRLLGEFDRLATELAAHLAYEEEQLVGALNETTLAA